MKLFDSVTFFDEEVILNLRLNILDPIVDKFIIKTKKKHEMHYSIIIFGSIMFWSSKFLKKQITKFKL